jgi:hypothetical protein
MSTQRISRADWPTFFDTFSHQNEGALAALETLSDDIGDQQTEALPFQGISFETKGSDTGAIIIMLGTEASSHVERVIPAPTAIYLKPDGEAGPAVLEILSEGEPTTLLHIKQPAALPSP